MSPTTMYGDMANKDRLIFVSSARPDVPATGVYDYFRIYKILISIVIETFNQEAPRGDGTDRSYRNGLGAKLVRSI